VLFAVTLFFCLLNSAYDGIANRNRQFDPQRWWYPVYQLITNPPRLRLSEEPDSGG
jgi:hypothetical protein